MSPLSLLFLCTIFFVSSQDPGTPDLNNVDINDPESLKKILVLLKDSLTEAKQNMTRLEQKIDMVKMDTQEEIKKVKTEADEKIKSIQNLRQSTTEAQETLLKLRETLSANRNFPNISLGDISDFWTGEDMPKSPTEEEAIDLEDDFIRVERSVEEHEGIAAANYTLLEQLIRLMVPVSCYEWKQYGFDVSGYYMIDADGRGIGEPAFTVYCDMISGYTFIHHDSEGQRGARSCVGKGCYTRNIKYGASKQQIAALMQRSDSCEQYIKIDCQQTPLRKNRELLSWWVDRNDEKHGYWAGEADKNHMCSCGQTRTCMNTRRPCNCDADVRDIWLVDEGHLTNMTSLPVYELHFGGRQDRFLQLKYTLGPLRCYGTRPIAHPESCMDLWVSGITQSGYYLLEVQDTIEAVFCNMSVAFLADRHSSLPSSMHMGNMVSAKQMQQLYWEMEHEVQYIKAQIRSHYDNVAFTAYCTSHYNRINSYIKFDRIPLNMGGGYNRSTGLFTAPKSGLYFFSAYLHNDDGNYRIKAYISKRGSEIARFRMDGGDIMEMSVGVSVAEYLEEGDDVGVMLSDGRGDGSDGRTQLFSGFLVR